MADGTNDEAHLGACDDEAHLAAWPQPPAPPAQETALGRGRVQHALPDLGRNAEFVTVRKVVLAPDGGTTGWHYHPGPVLAVINSGELTRVFTDLSVETVGAGRCFVESGGAEHAHNGTNLGSEPVVMYAVFFLPSADSQLAVDVPAPTPPAPSET